MELSFEEPDLHVVIRVPWKRPSSFKPPSQVIRSEEIDHELWKALSRQKEETIDWETLSREFNTTIPQLLRHSATLYEKKLQELTPTRKPTTEGLNFPPSSKDSRRHMESNEVEIKSNIEISQDKKHLAAIQKSYYDALKRKQVDPPGRLASFHEQDTQGRNSISSLEAKAHDDTQEEEDDSEDENEEVTDELLDERLSKLQIGMPSGLQQKSDSMISKEREKESGSSIHAEKSTNPEPDDEHHSAGSSFSDLSDSSVTQSAMEDAYLSKFNQSKLSMVSKKSQFLSSLLK
ncbi:hypothetical protein K7432_002674 [Basidiobolus ranarum]|uniref:Autophagy-related protein 29 n=1 Tax=Basidiobolus ranarum TaxID=34480 RepID=A0ABR2X164_9FUNG